MIVIVGAGVAGLSAAAALRDMGYGGRVRVLGGEPATPYERPALSKEYLCDPTLGDPPSLASLAALHARDIRLDLGVEVLSIERQRQALLTTEGEEVGYEELLLATGAEPRRLALRGDTLAGVHYLRDLEDARELRAALIKSRNVVIVGGGVIGLEVAASAIQRGCRVTMLEAAPRVMGRIVPERFAGMLEEAHRAHGVDVRTNTGPAAFRGSGGRIREVVITSGAAVPADVVVVGIGVKPRTLLAEGSGLDVNDGVVVDAAFRTCDRHIFAAGDVARVFHGAAGQFVRIEQWEPAREQGRQAAASMLGGEISYRETPWMWSDQYDVHIQATGLGKGTVEVVRGTSLHERGGISYFCITDGRLVSACGASVGTSVARVIRAAHKLIERGAEVTVNQLADPSVDLHRLARAAGSLSGT
ncbi:MAG TPA: FAD-dependent oxidoreductase [Solirubrobacteraceae bacterium]|jgi:3-phenylpropionate/trans-cinnamate dioxygenase ferredoxin reductase subunit|nr:FAD-dependent oxidoreductase [Solirubrobacteraceae bacterium]